VSRMRCSAKPLRSGAPLIRDRSKRKSLERSRVCSAPYHKRVHARLRRAMAVLRCARDKSEASVRIRPLAGPKS